MATPTRNLLPPFLQPPSPAGSAGPSAPPRPTNRVVAGLAEFSARIVAGEDDGTGLGRHFPAALRRGLEAGLPMLERQISTIPEAELAAGLRLFAGELERIASLADDDPAAGRAALA